MFKCIVMQISQINREKGYLIGRGCLFVEHPGTMYNVLLKTFKKLLKTHLFNLAYAS